MSTFRSCLRGFRSSVLRLLGKLGLLRLTYSAYQRLKVMRSAASGPLADQGLPVPPPGLIVLVAGTADVEWFLRSGRLAAGSIRDILARNGRPIEGFHSILDFGSGCGRVVRHWSDIAASIAGSDCNGQAVEWCRRNLPFARFEVNDLRPPLAFDREEFGFAYALSVFTHLPEELQFAWIDELRRVLVPDGLLLLTIHGERSSKDLTLTEQARFHAGECVVRWEAAAGTNLCSAYDPVSFVREKLARGFEVVDAEPEGAKGNPYQDVFLFRKRANSA
ncbi:MAG TPA: class I SAM-dependent methyltransferase [Methylomirabilota bacterium]|nr:class I SAM-dependent methyltransferase [Methylomirabilota bacterium]